MRRRWHRSKWVKLSRERPGVDINVSRKRRFECLLCRASEISRRYLSVLLSYFDNTTHQKNWRAYSAVNPTENRLTIVHDLVSAVNDRGEGGSSPLQHQG